MRTMRWAVAATAISLGFTGVANAQLTPFQFVGVNAGSVSVQTNRGETVVGGYYGLLNNTAVSLFCVDLKHNVNYNEGYNTLALLGKVAAPGVTALTDVPQGNTEYFYIDPVGQSVPPYQGAGLASALHANDYAPQPSGLSAQDKQDRSGAVAYLTDKYLSASVATQARVQLAIWEIVQDGFAADFSSGDFYLTANPGGTVLADALSYVSEAANYKSYIGQAEWIQAPRAGLTNYAHRQDFTYSPVPEPAFFQMGTLIGMSGLGLLRLRKRS